MAAAHAKLEQHKEAIAAAEKALACDESFAKAHARKAESLYVEALLLLLLLLL